MYLNNNGMGLSEKLQINNALDRYMYIMYIDLWLITCWTILHIFRHLIFNSKLTFSKISFKDTIRVSNSLDPDQTRCFVEPDLGPNCLQTTKEATSR